jgi:hypothetical protein
MEKVVSEKSATLDGVQVQSLARNHRNLVRFENAGDPALGHVLTHLRRLVNNAPRIARARLNKSDQHKIDPRIVYELRNNILNGADSRNKLETLSKELTSHSWLIDQKILKNWVSSDATSPPHLWISGPEGRGKTTAVVSIVHQLEQKRESTPTDDLPVLLAYFFCDKSPNYGTAKDVLKSLLFQLIDQEVSLAQHAQHFSRRKTKTTDNASSQPYSSDIQVPVNIQSLWLALQEMMADKTLGCVYIVVANLHHLLDDDITTAEFFSFIKDLEDINKGDQAPRIKWLFTSQERFKIKQTLDMTSVAQMDLTQPEYVNEIQHELQRYAASQVARIDGVTKYTEAFTFGAGAIIGRQASTNKWIDLTCMQLRSLVDADLPELEILRKVRTMPSSLDKYLDDAWNTVRIAKPTPAETGLVILFYFLLTTSGNKCHLTCSIGIQIVWRRSRASQRNLTSPSSYLSGSNRARINALVWIQQIPYTWTALRFSEEM